MQDPVHLKISAGHNWQGPIPAPKLEKLKSHAMCGARFLWAEDLEEYLSFQFVPFDGAATLCVETEDEDLFELFEEECSLFSISRIEINVRSKEKFEIKVPDGFEIGSSLRKQLNTVPLLIGGYIETLEKILKTQDGFSSILMDQGGFEVALCLENDKRPASQNDIIAVVSNGTSPLGEFEYFHGLIINEHYYEMSEPGPESYADSYYHVYYDENFSFMMSFNQWHGGLDLDEIGENYTSLISDDLIEAYAATNFKVFSDPPMTLKVGSYISEIMNLFKNHDVETAAFITAWNPFGKVLNENENKARNNFLRQSLDGKYIIIDGIGEDPDEKWPGEESILILGINRLESMEIGNKFEQNAIVFVNEDKFCELILLK